MRVVACLHSALAEPIRTFVEYKRALNRKYRPEAAALRLFDGTFVSTPSPGGIPSMAF